MKKLILTATALLAFAGLSQAAVISWGSTAQNIYKADGSGFIPVGGGVVQLVYVSGAYDSLTGTYATEEVVDSGLVGDNAALPAKGKYAGTYYYTYGVTTAGGQTITSGDTFVIRVYDAATVGAALNVWNSDAFSITATDDAGGDTLLLSSPTTTSGDWSPIEPIPEPATAGLLAMGLAAVALRRKFRK